jgi:hypothetical protein
VSRLAFALLVVASFLLPVAVGGSPQDPEIRGNPDKLVSTNGSTTIDAPEARIVAIWLDEPNDTTIRISWQVVDIAHRFQSDEILNLWLDCLSGPLDNLMGINMGGPFPQPVGYVRSYEENRVWFLPVTISGNVASITVTRAAFAQPPCVEPIGGFEVAFKSPLGNSWAPTSPVWWGQRAPETGYGRDFFF